MGEPADSWCAKKTDGAAIRAGYGSGQTVTRLDSNVLVVGHIEVAWGLGQHTAAGRCIQNLAFEGRGEEGEKGGFACAEDWGSERLGNIRGS